MKIKINYYRDHRDETGMPSNTSTWCHATWIDDAYDCSDPLDVGPRASEEEVITAARALYAHHAVVEVVVYRVDDL